MNRCKYIALTLTTIASLISASALADEDAKAEALVTTTEFSQNQGFYVAAQQIHNRIDAQLTAQIDYQVKRQNEAIMQHFDLIMTEKQKK